MFTIIGGDGREYGPATVEQLRAWIAAGRANLQTKARALGSDEWRRLEDFPEFGGPGDAPPVLPGRPPNLPTSGGRTLGEVTHGDLAGVGPRTGAALINAAIYFFAMLPGSLMMSRKLLEQNPDMARGVIPKLDELDLSGFMDAVGWVWMGLLSALLLQTVLIAFRGQNVGKMVVGVRIVRATDGGPAGFLRAGLMRFLLPVMLIMFLNILFPLGLLFLAIDYAFIFRADQRCLHDLMAGTKVVKA